MKDTINIYWMRRDLRYEDNHALFQSLQDEKNVLPIFIFDTNILNTLSDKKDKRVQLIHQRINELNTFLFKEYASGIKVFYGNPIEVFKELIYTYNIEKVYCNNDYEPYAIQRDKEIRNLLHTHHITFISVKDHVLFEPNEILKTDGTPYTIYTPYSKAWKLKLQNITIPYYPSEKFLNKLYRTQSMFIIPSLKDIGFRSSSYSIPQLHIDAITLKNYHLTRDRIDNDKGTSHTSTYLRFGLISTSHIIRLGIKYNEKYLNELIWREFFQQILFHFPYTANQNYQKKYDELQWENKEEWFELWKQGKTGFPIIDAAMTELNTTGYMHNRCRMIVANFLTKILLIDWRWGERYFAEKLLDYEMASNVGNWQWAAGTGVDAAPYFRIFNPYLQQQKFDPNMQYIKKWIPNFDAQHYIKPIVNLDERKKECLKRFKYIGQNNLNI